MVNLCLNDDEGKMEVMRAGGSAALVDALRAHPTDQKLQQMCRAAMGEIKPDD